MPQDKEIFLVDKEELGADYAERAKNLKKLLDDAAEDFTPDELEILRETHKNLEALAAQERRDQKKEMTGVQQALTDRDIMQLLDDLGYEHISFQHVHTLLDRALAKMKKELEKLGVTADDIVKRRKGFMN